MVKLAEREATSSKDNCFTLLTTVKLYLESVHLSITGFIISGKIPFLSIALLRRFGQICPFL
jgi:hypothetical protein